MDDCFLLIYHNKTLHGRLVVLATCVDVSKTSTLKVGVDTQHVLHGCSLFSLPPSQSEPSNLCPAYWTGEFSGNAHDRETHEKSRWRIAEIHVDVWEGTILIPGDTHMTPRYPLRLELKVRINAHGCGSRFRKLMELIAVSQCRMAAVEPLSYVSVRSSLGQRVWRSSDIGFGQ